MISAASFLFSFCSLGYNFIFSHFLAISLGATVVQYCIGLGLYVFSLGAGSMFFDQLKTRRSLGALIRVEVLICLIAFVGTFVIVFNDFLSRQMALPAIKLVSYMPTVLLGFLSGMELPILLSYGGVRLSRRIIAADFFGMAAMCLVFGFVLVPFFGFISSLFLCISLNVLTLLVFLASRGTLSFPRSGMTFFIAMLFLFLPPWEEWIRCIYLAS